MMADPVLPPGAAWLRDPATGQRVVRWTADGCSQHLYFTCPSVTADDHWLVVISDRDGHPNLWAADRRAGTWRRLSANRSGTRRAYCHPQGGAAGLTKASACLDPVGGVAYAVIDNQVWRLPLAVGRPEVLADLPSGTSCGFCHVAPDGGRLCLTLVDAETLAAETATQRDQMAAAALVVAAGRSRTLIEEVDTGSGRRRTRCAVPFWATHVQYDPAGHDRIIFNSEGPWSLQDRIPRIWVQAGYDQPAPLYAQDPREQVGHENILPDGSAIVYHGVAQDDHFICVRDWSGRLLSRLPMPDRPEAHHATPMPGQGGFLADCHDGMIHIITTAGGRPVFKPVAGHGVEDWTAQDDHPHPIANPDGLGVVFTARAMPGREVRELRP
jgi:hypothetical protein